jgi:hypothetical protein
MIVARTAHDDDPGRSSIPQPGGLMMATGAAWDAMEDLGVSC